MTPIDIEPSIIAHLQTIPGLQADELFYITDFGTPLYGITVSHLSYNQTYKQDGGDGNIDETIKILIKLKNKAQVTETRDLIIENLIGSQIDDSLISIVECLLLRKNPILKESEEVNYTVLSFRFRGNFK